MKKSFRIGRKSVAVLPKEKKEVMEGQNRRISEIGFLSVEIAFIGRKSFVIIGRARGKNSLDRVEWWFLTRFQVLPV